MAHAKFQTGDAVNEKSSAQYTCTLTDHTGTVIPSASISAITATLKDQASGTTVNSRSAQNVFGANGGTMHATSGLFTLVLGASDTALVGTATTEYQERRLTLDVTFTTGRLTHLVTFFVRALADIS